MLTGEAYELYNESIYNSSVDSDPHLIMYNILQFFREIIGFHINIFPYGDRISWCFNISDIYNDPSVPATYRLTARKISENRTYQRFISFFSALKASIKYANTIFNNKEKFKFSYKGKERFNYTLHLNIVD